MSRYWCPPASPIKGLAQNVHKGFGTEGARLGTFKEISKNRRFLLKKPEVLYEKLKTVSPGLILIKKKSNLHLLKILKPIILLFCND